LLPEIGPRQHALTTGSISSGEIIWKNNNIAHSFQACPIAGIAHVRAGVKKSSHFNLPTKTVGNYSNNSRRISRKTTI